MDVDQYQVVEDGLPVQLPSGAEFTVLTQSEVDYVRARVDQYKSTYRWENVSDVQDVDRIVIFELLVYRWGSDMARGRDIHGDETDDANLQKRVKEISAEIRQIKAQMGMDKASRDKENDESSVSAYLDRLRKRAKEFGIMREEQFDKALELTHSLIALYQLHINCDDTERRQEQCEAQDIVDWIGEVYKPQFEAVDAHFRNRPDGQRAWAGTL
jgi:hypothetical protein